jgi:TRAP transporter TAXI family solute receptor
MEETDPFARVRGTQWRELFLVVGPAVAVVAAAFWLTWQFVQPAPPSTITISTGGDTGAYYAFALKYKAVLAEAGVTLEVKTSKGSIENLARLADKKSGIDLAFVQGGILSSGVAAKPDIQSVGRLFYEPLWVFSRSAQPISKLGELVGRKIVVGPDGSGTAVLARGILEATGVTAANATLLTIGSNDAVAALRSGAADVAFFVAAPDAPIVQKLLTDPYLFLMNIEQSEALSRRFPYLTRVTLPRGVIDLVNDKPSTDVALVAPTAALVVRTDLHPALSALLAETVISIHDKPSLLQGVGVFPTAKDPELPVAEEAQRVYRSGTPFLQRYLPFWAANFAERMVILLVPLLTILLPLFQIVPMLFRWRVQRRIFFWYGHLKRVEKVIGEQPTASTLAAAKREIDRIDTAVRSIPIPVGYSEQFYSLRSAVDLVRQRLDGISRGGGQVPAAG